MLVATLHAILLMVFTVYLCTLLRDFDDKTTHVSRSLRVNLNRFKGKKGNATKKPKIKKRSNSSKATLSKSKLFHPSNMYMNLYIGFSTGHCGTTTLSNVKVGTNTKVLTTNLNPLATYDYKDPDSVVAFVYEKADVRYQRYAAGFDEKKEYEHVRKTYIPYVITKLSGSKVSDKVKTKAKSAGGVVNVTAADMSHASLNFYKGLVRYAKENGKWMNLHFVRIRRDRIESAISMSSSESFIKHDYYRYNPLENRENVINKVSPEMWNDFHIVQKALWFVDETEARWQKLLRDEPWLPHTETFWGNRWSEKGSSIMKVARTIANLTGTVCNADLPHARVHAGATRKENMTLYMDVLRLDKEYQRMMGYDYIPA
jgi:hypothetical protein